MSARLRDGVWKAVVLLDDDARESTTPVRQILEVDGACVWYGHRGQILFLVMAVRQWGREFNDGCKISSLSFCDEVELHLWLVSEVRRRRAVL